MVADRTRAALRLAAVMWMVACGTASAQTVLNPTMVEFEPSPDHAATSEDGQPIVESYSLRLFTSGATAPFQTVALGKPTPGTDGLIRVGFISLLTPMPEPGVPYEARVAALGPGGTASSETSNAFAFEPVSCTYALGGTSHSVAAPGGADSVAVSAGAGCSWTAASSVPWVSITDGASGAGSGTVSFAVAANTSTSARSTALTIAGQSFTVSQAAGDGTCSYSLAPASQSFAAAAATGSATMTAGSACAWTATRSASWITITSGASDTGNGTITYSVTANTSSTARSGSISAGGRLVAITQAGAACTYAVSPLTRSVAAAAGTGSVALTTPTGCEWTATSDAAWLTLPSATSGTTSRTITFAFPANTAAAPRTGTLTIAGHTVTVTQAGTASTGCTYSLSSSSGTVPPAGGRASFRITAGTGCAWSATANRSWITVNASGTGSGTVTFTAAANTTRSTRSGTISVGGRTYTVTQAPTVPSAPGNFRIVR